MGILKISELNPGQFQLEGELTFGTINKKTAKHLGFSTLKDTIVIDLSKITTTDSAGLALIIEWMKLAGKNQSQIVYENIPEQLIALAKLSGFEQFLRCSAEQRTTIDSSLFF